MTAGSLKGKIEWAARCAAVTGRRAGCGKATKRWGKGVACLRFGSCYACCSTRSVESRNGKNLRWMSLWRSSV